MNEYLKRRVARLTIEQKADLRDYLTASIERGTSKSSLRCSILMGDMAKVIGMDSVSYFNRDSSDVWARAMIAFQMLKEGYTTTEIGRQMMKDHSTIQHYKKKMEDVFSIPEAYRDILTIWDKFLERI